MTSRYTVRAVLVLALFCTACGVQAMPSHPPPSSEASDIPQDHASMTAGPPALTMSPSPFPVSPAVSATPPPAPPEFSEPFDSQPHHWSFLQIDNGQPFAGPVLRDGFLVFDLPAPNQSVYALYQGRAYGDVMVEAEFQSRVAGDGAAGILCRYDEKNGWYEINIYADQTYQLLFGQWLAPGVARYTPLYRGTSAAIKADANRVGLRCQGNILTPVINGAPLRQWQEQRFGLQKGQIGLTVSSFMDAPFAVAFDSFTASEP